jgi:hypothetical protein
MLNPLFAAMQTKDAETLNGAITNSTTQDKLLDLFFIAGACRNETEENINKALQAAYIQDSIKTLKIIFWAGDIREGAGERRFFRIALKWLENNYKDTLERIIPLVPEYSRWDSLFHLKSEQVLKLVGGNIGLEGLPVECGYNQLLAKWLPRNGSDKFKEFKKAFQTKYRLNDAQYRKLIATCSRTVEQQMSKKEWAQINYEHVPSVASNKYREAFFRNDGERYSKFIEDVTKGEKKINASAIFPHDLYKALTRGDDAKAVDAQWNSLPNYLKDSNEKILPICDVSGSMDSPDKLPIAISIALGIYFSERNNSIFKDGFITFSRKPKLQFLKGTFSEKVKQFDRDFAENTNLISALSLILDKAQSNNLNQEDLPTTLLIISDMEFDSSCDENTKTNYEKIQELYQVAGYNLPKIVFWNVNARVGNYPIKQDDRAILVSGASPSIIKAVLAGETDPTSVLDSTINATRYNRVEDVLV